MFKAKLQKRNAVSEWVRHYKAILWSAGRCVKRPRYPKVKRLLSAQFSRRMQLTSDSCSTYVQNQLGTKSKKKVWHSPKSHCIRNASSREDWPWNPVLSLDWRLRSMISWGVCATTCVALRDDERKINIILNIKQQERFIVIVVSLYVYNVKRSCYNVKKIFIRQ